MTAAVGRASFLMVLLLVATPPTTIHGQSSLFSGSQQDCLFKRDEAQRSQLLNSYVPQCELNGQWSARQCGNNDDCWCVTENGVQITGSTQKRWETTVDCLRERQRVATGISGTLDPNQCATNEEFKTCGTACEATCQNRQPTCNTACRQGCFCRLGYIREFSTGRCVPELQCSSSGGTGTLGVGFSGNCPPPKYSASNCPSSAVFDRCGDDNSCTRGQICCQNGCYKECITPGATQSGSLGSGSVPFFGSSGSSGSGSGNLKPGACPRTISGSFVGSCSNPCVSDGDCVGSKKCCDSIGCGRDCRDPSTTLTIDPCQSSPCPLGQQCVPRTQPCLSSFSCADFECRQQSFSNERPGTCPLLTSTFIGRSCNNDFECSTNEKCCSTGFTRACVTVFNGDTFPTLAPTTITATLRFSPTISQTTRSDGCSNKERFSNWEANCQLRCEHLAGAALECPAETQQGCVCVAGYLRSKNGSCITADDCRQQSPQVSTLVLPFAQQNTTVTVTSRFGGSQLCNLDEIFSSSCERSCLDVLANRFFATDCPSTASNEPRCTCQVGRYRSSSGSCVSEDDCRRAASNPSSTGSLAQQNCAFNENFQLCGTNCEPTCQDRNPICSNTACRRGCFCASGYIRERSGGLCIAQEFCTVGGTLTIGGSNSGGVCSDPLKTFSQCNAHPDCQRTCDNLNAALACPTGCLSGCVCTDTYVLLSRQSTSCVRREQCSFGGAVPTFGGTINLNQLSQVRRAVAVFEGGTVFGTVTFTQLTPTGPVRVSGTLNGLPPNQRRGFHIRERGDLTNRCNNVGRHYNPRKEVHGGRTDTKRHVGDLSNIQADFSGRAVVDFEDAQISLNGPFSVVGRPLSVSEREDDLGRSGSSVSVLDGNAGNAVACALIGVQEEQEITGF